MRNTAVEFYQSVSTEWKVETGGGVSETHLASLGSLLEMQIYHIPGLMNTNLHSTRLSADYATGLWTTYFEF